MTEHFPITQVNIKACCSKNNSYYQTYLDRDTA